MNKRLIPDRELAPILGVSLSFLRKDRCHQRRIPYYEIGRRCLYDADEAIAALPRRGPAPRAQR